MDELNGRMIACQILITGLIARERARHVVLATRARRDRNVEDGDDLPDPTGQSVELRAELYRRSRWLLDLAARGDWVEITVGERTPHSEPLATDAEPPASGKRAVASA